MRKLACTLLVTMMTLTAASVSARNVPVDEAREAAAHYMRLNKEMPNISVDDVVLVHQIDNENLGIPAVYFFNVGRSGWIIMGANTAANAVLAFSECGSIVVSEMPEIMLLLLDDHATIIKAVQDAEEGTKFEDTDEWSDLLNKRVTHNTKDTDHILLDDEWDQNGDFDGFRNGTTYDMLTPVINGDHAPVGCVATALSQLFHYYKYPVQPTGQINYVTSSENLRLTVDLDTVQFDYSKMPSKIVASTPTEERYEISKLCYMVGVAVSMDYRQDASGATSTSLPGTVMERFKYKRGTMNYRRSSFTGDHAEYLQYAPYNRAVDDSVFLPKVRNELLNHRVVYMDGSSSIGSGRDAAGHAWLCTGYRDTNENMYFMNWGWGGHYNSWFNLKSNNMYISQQYLNLKVGQGAITGMIPPPDSTEVDVYAGIHAVAEQTTLAPAYPNPAFTTVRLPYSIGADAEMTIYGMDGRKVDSLRLRAGEGYVEVRVSELPAGIYLYRVNGATGRFIVR